MLSATLVLATCAVQARESDRQQPMSVAADQTDTILTEDGESKLRGNVSIAQGTLLITAGEATFARKAGEVVRVVFEGTPATLQQENDNGALMKAQGNRIDYDVDAETVTLTGNVAVDQAGDSMRGERIVYDLKNGRLNGAGDGSTDGRIRMTIQPRPDKPEATKPDAAKATDPEAARDDAG
jgi:lipopolysaccharide export system protein LptA